MKGNFVKKTSNEIKRDRERERNSDSSLVIGTKYQNGAQFN